MYVLDFLTLQHSSFVFFISSVCPNKLTARWSNKNNVLIRATYHPDNECHVINSTLKLCARTGTLIRIDACGRQNTGNLIT